MPYFYKWLVLILTEIPLLFDFKDKLNSPDISKNDFIQQFIKLKRQNWLFLFILVACVVSVMAISLKEQNIYDNNHSSGTDSSKERIQREKFKSFIGLMKSKYPNQTNLFWANIQSTYRHSILKAKDPSIVLIVSDKKTR